MLESFIKINLLLIVMLTIEKNKIPYVSEWF
jgi:hypothetical protein